MDYTGEVLQNLGLYILGAQGLSPGRDIYRDIPAVTPDLELVFSWFHPKNRPIQSPLTTNLFNMIVLY